MELGFQYMVAIRRVTMPEPKGKSPSGRMTAEDAQAAAEAAAQKAAAELKAKQDAQAKEEAVRKQVESYELKKAAERARDERLAGTRQAAAQKKYVVKAGDSLSKIAKEQLGDAKRWSEIQKLNKIENPNLIRVGQELVLPD
jgi:nucleoid-associated protein YgaU